MPWNDDVDVWLTEEQSLENAQLVANHFLTTGWTKNSISAICGNMRHESSINPNVYEFGFGHDPSKGYGLVQWTPMTKLTTWCATEGIPYDDGDSQLSRIDYERAENIQWFNNPNTPEYDGISWEDFVESTDSVDELTKVFMAKYEHPNWEAGMESLPDRQSFANRCYNELDWGGGPNPPDPVSGQYEVVAMLLSDALNGWKM